MSGIDKLRNLPLSHLFSGPLVAAIDASVQSQQETVNLLMETGFDENGDLVTVSFEYPDPRAEPESGATDRATSRVEIPLLLFLTLPNLQISRIEEEFSAEITGVTESSGTESGGAVSSPLRLQVKPAGRSTEFKRTMRSKFDLDVRMVAEIRNESTGMELLERAANNANFDQDEARRADDETERPRLTPERINRARTPLD